MTQGLPSPEAFAATDEILQELGIDISEAATNQTIAAFVGVLMRNEQRKIDGTYGETIEGDE